MKLHRLRGGYRVSAKPSFKPPVKFSTPGFNKSTASKLAFDFASAAASKYGPVLGAYAKNYAYRKLNEFVSKSDTGVSATVPNGLSVRSIGTPTVFGNYGSITTTNYTEGKYYLPKRISSEYGEIVRVNNLSGRITAGTSLQNNASVSTVSGLDLYSLGQDLSQFTSSNLTAETQQGEIKLYIHQVQTQIRFTNSGNVGVVLDLYEVVPRIDIDFNETDIFTPSSAWNTGLAKQLPIASMTVTSVGPTTFGISPLDSIAFGSVYLVKKKFSIELPGATSHVHKSTYNINKHYNTARIESVGTLSSYKGFTKWYLMNVSGNPVHDGGTGATIGTSAVSVDYVTSSRIKAYGNSNAQKIVGIRSGLAIPGTPSIYVTNITDTAVSTH